ncbi:DUF47 family protein [Gemmatimonas sp.]|uniref:DUF47 domain-containing protein n=1 Tax=Gemmatimonas sp. TaxID=1962908 RepID=UPI00286D9182|nr:DUF47 family protein [Gemmatimonas sp.]
MKLFSPDEEFFNSFRQLAERIGHAAVLIGQLFDTPRESARIAAEIKKLETDGDEIVRQINQRIDTSFVTPLDREDIHMIAKRLNNVIDSISGVARRVVMFRVTESRSGAKEMSSVIVRAAVEIQNSIGDINKRPKMLEHSRHMKILEEEGDKLYAASVGNLFEPELQTIEVLKWKEIYDLLEEAIDECEGVSNVLDSIALKNS